MLVMHNHVKITSCSLSGGAGDEDTGYQLGCILTHGGLMPTDMM